MSLCYISTSTRSRVAVADPEGDPRVHRTPLWAAPSTKKYTDVRLNGTPLSGYRTKKTAPTAHLRML